MSMFEKESLTTTLKHYTDSFITPQAINKLTAEIIDIINKVNRKGFLESGLIEELKKTSQLLYDELFTKEVKAKLAKSTIANLIFSIDEQLVNIPWELLYDGETFLCLKFSLGRSIRTGQVDFEPHYRGQTEIPKMLVLSNPAGDLEFAHQEGISIRNKLDKKRDIVHVDLKSLGTSIAYVKKNLRDYDIVHFAGHCDYNLNNPSDSGWVFRDGKLTVKDILGMAQATPLPNIVFSNSCQSADETLRLVDSGKKIYGLANAFLLSGVRHYIGTFWKIPDEMSLSFAEEFYSHIISGYSVGEAVRQARWKLINKYGYDSIIWASYILYGDPTLTLFKQKTQHHASKINLIKWSKIHRKQVVGLLYILLVISLGAGLIKYLIDLNPSAFMLFRRTHYLFLKGENQKAIEICSEIIERDKDFIGAYKQMGDVYDRLADRQMALKYYFEYAMLSEKKEDRNNLACAYIRIAWTYHMQGDYPKAFEYYEKGISLSRDNQDKLNEADGLSRLAVWHMEKEDYETALELLIKSSQINKERAREPKHRYNLACDYFNIGLLFINKDDFKAARKFYNLSAEIFSKMKNKSDISDYYCNLGEIYSLEKEYHKALEYYFKSLKIDTELERRWDIGVNYNIIGELYLEIGELAKAEDFFHKALLMRQQIKDLPGLAETYHNIGLLSKKRGQMDKAREYMEKSLKIYKNIEIPNYKYVEEDLRGLLL